MQVALAAQTVPSQNRSWSAFVVVSRGFSIYTLVCVTGVALFLLFLFLALGLRQAILALNALYHKRRNLGKAQGAK